MSFKMFFGHTGLGEIIKMNKQIATNAVNNDKPILAIGIIELESSSVPLVINQLLWLCVGITLLRLCVSICFLGFGICVGLLCLGLLLVVGVVVWVIYHLLLHVVVVGVVGLGVVLLVV